MNRFKLVGPTLFVLAIFLSGCAGEADANVLFIGNSFTFGNDVPGLVEQIAEANGSTIDTTTIAEGGAFLDEHIQNPDVIAAVSSGDYDIVVLQEQSMAPAHRETFTSRTLPAAKVLDEFADASGTEVVLYQTWGHVNGNSTVGHGSYSSMQDHLVRSYDYLADETGANVARVGQAWQGFLPTGVSDPLHDIDGVHATAAGSYLSALVLAQWVSTEPIREAPAIGEVDEDLAMRLFTASW